MRLCEWNTITACSGGFLTMVGLNTHTQWRCLHPFYSPPPRLVDNSAQSILTFPLCVCVSVCVSMCCRALTLIVFHSTLSSSGQPSPWVAGFHPDRTPAHLSEWHQSATHTHTHKQPWWINEASETWDIKKPWLHKQWLLGNVKAAWPTDQYA